MRSAIVDRPIDPSDLLNEVARTANGASVLFIGTVREVNDGRHVSGIEYSAYRSMADSELAEILSEASQRFGTRDIVVEHRLGVLELGEASVAIAVAHPHRGLAYEASRYVIEQLKLRVPIWKLEHYIDGSREWVNAGTGKKDAVEQPETARPAAELVPGRHEMEPRFASRESAGFMLGKSNGKSSHSPNGHHKP